jgi:hypothetical protein
MSAQRITLVALLVIFGAMLAAALLLLTADPGGYAAYCPCLEFGGVKS